MFLKRSLKVMLTVVLSSIALFFVLTIGLIASQRITPLSSEQTLTFESVRSDGADTSGLEQHTVRDGTTLHFRHYPGASDEAPLAVVIHGSGWHGGAYTFIGRTLSEAQGFEVLVPDLRGHGPNPIRRGDIDYIGQLEDDLADLIAAHNTTGRPVYMVGHSSGGGLVVRFAGGQHGALLNKAVLMAPFLKHDAPTARNDAGGWSHVLMRRVIGQSILNGFGIKWFNGLHMIQFNFPAEIMRTEQGKAATLSYSFRLNTSYAPRDDYLADVAQLPEFLVIAAPRTRRFTQSNTSQRCARPTPRGNTN